MTEPIIGIDLGTTYSCVAVCKNGKVEIIPNEQGHRITPSCVAFTDTERLVGNLAKDQDYKNPTNTIFDSKRLIGRVFNDPTVQDDMKNWPFEIIEENEKPKIKVKYKGKEKTFFPEQISAMLLVKMREIAETYLGERVRKAVITVPAYFNNSQRQTTQVAGAIAGLNVIRIINEPTAAALAYGFDKESLIERNVLVYDFGGGTFDVSILSIEHGVFEVKGTMGDTHLGGEDLDNRMVVHFAKEFERKYNSDLMENKQALRRLRTACEKAKRTLSTSQLASIDLQFLHENIDFQASLTRARFEDMNKDLFKATIDMVENALKQAEMNKSDIHDVVLVGGSTRIPMVQKLLQDFFDGKQLNRSISPDEAVASGAAIQAAIMSADQSNALKNLVLVDVTPLSLGSKSRDGRMVVVVERNTPIPTRKTKECIKTAHDDQTRMTFKIYEGERAMAEDNNILGKFTLNGITPAPRGQTKVKLTFDIDQNGIVEVTAAEETTTNSKSVRIVNDSCHSKEDIDKMISDAEFFKKDDEEKKEKARARGDLDYLCYTVKNKVEDMADDIHKQVVLNKCHEILTWLDANNDSTKEEYEQKNIELKQVHNSFLKLTLND